MRYFKNNLPDYIQNTAVNIDTDNIKQRISEYVQLITSQQPPSIQGCDGGLYVGVPGISYMFYYLAKSQIFSQQQQQFLHQSAAYMSVSLQYINQPRQRKDMGDKVAFVLGSAGVNAVGAVLYSQLNEADIAKQCLQEYRKGGEVCQQTNFLSCGSDELLVGRAGYLFGVLWLQKQLKQPVLDQAVLSKVLDAVIKSGVEYAKKHKSPSPLMYSYYKTEYIGAAHGISGIMFALLCFPEYLQGNRQAAQLVKDTIDFILSLEQPNGNYAPAMDEVGHQRSDRDELVHWCHGAPGVVYMLAKAYLTYKEEKYLNACIRCADLTWNKGLLTKGAGICHGVAGSGYVFLLLYRLTSDNKYLHRAQQFANFLSSPEFQSHARTPDSPYSLYEGLAGTVCFLLDLMQPHAAAFPFFDVFG